MAADAGPRSLIAITIQCSAGKQSKQIKSCPHLTTISEIYKSAHPEPLCGFTAKCSTGLDGGDGFQINPGMTLADIKGLAEIKSFLFICDKPKDQTEDVDTHQGKSAGKSASNMINAFNVLMEGPKTNIPKKQACHNRKDELYNDVVELLQKKGLTLHRSSLADEGQYIVQVLTNALWCLTNHHITINDAARISKDVIPVPELFKEFQGYNEIKRKKVKCQQLDQTQCNSHANALFSLISRPVFHSDNNWIEFRDEMESLANCLIHYKTYLEKKLDAQTSRQSMSYPPRTVGNDISVEFRVKTQFVYDKYKLIDEQMKDSDILKPVLFDENTHLATPFNDRMQKKRFFDNLRLSVDVDMYRYCPGGSVCTIMFLAKVPENRHPNEAQVQPLRVLAQIHGKLPEYHTRHMRREFKKKLNLVANVKPATLDYLYKELALDASASTNPIMQQRIKMIALGETGLVADLREMNPGRPMDKFDVFLSKLEEVVENATAADERRHGVAHLSHWISLSDLMSQAAEKCPENTLVPSKSLVRLQFTPRNPYTHSALNFTSRIPVQYKIQRRQLRIQHPDQHFCAAQYKYFKSKVIELGPEVAKMVCCDDKAKVPVGDPGVVVSTGVRGKKTLAPVSSSYAALDHDMTKSSLCPSVYLECDTPEDPQQSFVRGQVSVVVNDSVLQSSNPFRHAAILCNMLSKSNQKPKVLLRFSDGGTDQRNTLESVKCAAICIFKEMNLDMLILGRCAPGHSWTNPAERVMSILNLGLQNCALERADDDHKFKDCNSMAQIRDKISRNQDLKPVWEGSIGPVQEKIEARFQRLKLKDVPFQVIHPATSEDIQRVQRHLNELFPDMDITKLQKAHTKKVRSYQTFLESHCRQRHYLFQIRKCQDDSCCRPPIVDQNDLAWLPDPVMNEDGEHYKSYLDVKGQDTTEEDRPTYQKPVNVACNKKARKSKGNLRSAPLCETTECEGETHDSSVYTAQNARSVVECCECQKPRIIYSKRKLTDRQLIQLTLHLSEFEYSCGSFITPPSSKLHGVVFVRTRLSCSDTIELAYYNYEAARKDLCCFCATPQAEVNADLKKQYRTVLPICQECAETGKKPVCQRPYKSV